MTPGEKLLWDMKVTASARFIASARLAAKDRFWNLSLAAYSAIVVSTSLIALVFDLGPTIAKLVNVATLIASIVSLVISMKIYTDRYAVDAEQMHRCALEINEARRVFLVDGLRDDESLLEATKAYSLVLQKYSINHTEQDYLKYKYSHRWEFDDLRKLDKVKADRQRSRVLRTSNLIEKWVAGAGIAGLAAAMAALAASLAGL